MRNLLWLIPLLPFVGALLNGVLLRGRLNNRGVAAIACGVTGLAALLALLVIGDYLAGSQMGRQPFEQELWTWMPAGPIHTALDGVKSFTVSMGFQLDPLSCVMLFVVTFVGFLIHVYSVGYMAHDPSFRRFFLYLNLFMFAMLTLVLADNFLLMFVGWEGVGLCSYLLIGYYLDKEEAAPAAKEQENR